MAEVLKKTARTGSTSSKRKTTPKPRQIKKPAYTSFRLSPRIKAEGSASAWKVLKTALGMLGRNWKVFTGIVLVYGVLNALLVQSFNAVGDVDQAKDAIDKIFTGNFGQLTSGLTVFVYLLGSSGNTTNPTAGAYQLMLTLVISLALIWVLRHIYAGDKVRVRDGFYQGMAPLVRFVLVVFAIFIQLIPIAVGLLLYSLVTSNNIASGSLEEVLWVLFLSVMSVISLYLLSSSIFAPYIVTLPNMTPMRALKSARQLVKYRRWAVMRKILFLPLALALLAAILVVPVILFATAAAGWVFFLLTMLILPAIHSYMYALYRSLL